MVRAGVGRGGERRHRSRAGATVTGIAGAGRVQPGLAEMTDRPCVVVVSCREGCLPAVQPWYAWTVNKVWSTDLTASEARWKMTQNEL